MHPPLQVVSIGLLTAFLNFGSTGIMRAEASDEPPLIPALLSLNKSATFVQTASGATPLEGTPFIFLALAVGTPDVLTLDQPVLRLPTSEEESLVFSSGTDLPFPGWILSYPLPNQTQLEADYPPGSYRFSFDYDVLGAAKGKVQLSVEFPGDRRPPTPVLIDLPAAQQICANADFVLESVPFVGATEFDQVTAQIYSATLESEVLFSTNAIPAGAGPVRLRLPANTLQPERDYVLRLAYDAFAGASLTNVSLLGGAATLGVTARSSHTTITRIPLRTELCPRLQVVRPPEGSGVRLRFDAVSGQAYDIEASTNLTVWQTTLTTNAAADRVEIPVEPAAEGGGMFFRVRRP